MHKRPEDRKGSKMGRPESIKLDWDLIDEFLKLQAEHREIAAYFCCHVDLLNKRCKIEHNCTFSDYAKEKREAGKLSLRQQMMKSSESGNVAMQIWLSKNYMGMADKQEIKNEITGAKIQLYMPDNERDYFKDNGEDHDKDKKGD